MDGPMNVDHKFYGEIRKTSDDSIVPPEELVIFRAKDLALPRALLAYHDECRRLGSPVPHLIAARDMYDRVVKWQIEHPNECKVPD